MEHTSISTCLSSLSERMSVHTSGLRYGAFTDMLLFSSIEMGT